MYIYELSHTLDPYDTPNQHTFEHFIQCNVVVISDIMPVDGDILLCSSFGFCQTGNARRDLLCFSVVLLTAVENTIPPTFIHILLLLLK